MTRACCWSDEAAADNKPEMEIVATMSPAATARHHRRGDESLCLPAGERACPREEAQACDPAVVGEGNRSIATDGCATTPIAAAQRLAGGRG